MKSARRQSQFLAGRLLLRRALEFHLALPASSFEILAPENSAPRLERGPRFSLSHCEGMAACFLSEEACGVDVEDASVQRDFSRLAESAGLGELSSGEEFYEAWCEKEARFKAGEACAWMGRFSWKNYRLCLVAKSRGPLNFFLAAAQA
jgi:4'-phosphopantetheinyl transferase